MKEFKDGKLYAFSKKKFEKVEREKVPSTAKAWQNEANGCFVRVFGKEDGATNKGYLISPEWCVEVKCKNGK